MGKVVVFLTKFDYPVAYTQDGYSDWEVDDSRLIRDPKNSPDLQDVLKCKDRKDVEILYKSSSKSR